jgi:outer membrane protein OmpA-like peptidoglycan-associated protein
MEKKKLLVLFMCGALAVSNLFSQQIYSHWSFAIKGGVDRGEWGKEIKNGYYGYELGGALEYTFNPLFGIGADYSYLKYGRETSNDDITGTTHEAVLFGSVNALNLVAKYRQGNWQKLNIYANLGAGLSFYSTDKTDQITIVLPLSAALEYNVSKYVAIGLTGERRWHTSNDMGLGNMGVSRTNIWSALATVRVKFGAGSKPHVRNVALTEYEAVLDSTLMAKPYDDSELKKAINDNAEAIERLQEQTGRLNADMSKANDELNKLKDDIAKCQQTRSEGTNAAQQIAGMPAMQNVEYAFNSYQIPRSFNAELDALATAMKEQPDAKVTLTGHTDNVGTEQYNQGLSVRRANAVSSYLVKKGISKNRIIVQGVGEKQPVASNDTEEGRQKNRRVEFSISK